MSEELERRFRKFTDKRNATYLALALERQKQLYTFDDLFKFYKVSGERGILSIRNVGRKYMDIVKKTIETNDLSMEDYNPNEIEIPAERLDILNHI